MNPYYTNLTKVITPLSALTSFIRANSANWEESSEVIPTVTNHLSTSNITISSLRINGPTRIEINNNDNNALTIGGNISAINFRTSFNLGSATGQYSHAVGDRTIASGSNSHAEGSETIASGSNSHAEGSSSRATGQHSHAEGFSTLAQGNRSHAEGNQSVATGTASHAQNTSTRAEGEASFAAGFQSRAVGFASQAIGYNGIAAHDQTFIWADSNGGIYSSVPTISTTRSNQFMISATGGMFIPGRVGIGTDNNNNALTVNGTISSNKINIRNADLSVSTLGGFSELNIGFNGTDYFYFNEAGLLKLSGPNYGTAILNTSTIPAGITRSYTFPSNPGTLAILSDIYNYTQQNFLSLSGGSLTGSLSVLGNLTYIDTNVAVLSTMYIDANSTETALRITQNGSGDVLRVEDSTNPDTTPFIINSNGLVGIGTAAPNNALTVVGNVSATGTVIGSTTVQSNLSLESSTVGLTAADNIVLLTQTAYDLLAVKRPTTVYIIV